MPLTKSEIGLTAEYKSKFKSIVFRYSDIEYGDIYRILSKERGLYQWFLCPEVSNIESSEEVKTMIESMKKVPHDLYGERIRSDDNKSLFGFIGNCYFDLLSDTESNRLPLNELLNNRSFRNIFLKIVPDIFLLTPPINVGVAMDSFLIRLTSHEKKQTIQKVLDKITINKSFSVESCLVRCIYPSEDFFNIDNLQSNPKVYADQFVYLMEKWLLKWDLPPANVKRGN